MRSNPIPVVDSFRDSRQRFDVPSWYAWSVAIFFAYLAYLLSRPFYSGVFWMDYMQDDFFYYLKIAQNISLGHGSTFNGIVATNGYHPLFEGLLVMLAPLLHTPKGILAFQAMLILAASVATFLLCTYLLRRTEAHPVPVVALAAWITLYSLRLFYYGMETTLAIPLTLATVALTLRDAWWRSGGWRALALGLLASVTILARLDSAILMALLALCCALQPQLRAGIRPRTLLLIGVGLLPVALYVAVNHHLFGVWMPVSGLAKQLKSNHLPSRAVWHGLYWFLPGYLAVMLPIPIAIALLPRAWRWLSPIERGVLVASLSFPWVYYFILSCLSDWTIWGWYMYPLRVAVLASFYLFLKLPPLRSLLELGAVRALLALIAFVFLLNSQWRIQLPELYAASQDLAAFAATHPGPYAMGDRAGSFGYLTSNPVVQTEGLVMDKSFLANIREQRPLREVLQAYGARYYVGTVFPSNASALSTEGCFQAVEPLEGGPGSPKMRSTFCGPVLRIEHDGVVNLVYDLGAGQRQDSAPIR
jgi:hypothetical protein